MLSADVREFMQELKRKKITGGMIKIFRLL